MKTETIICDVCGQQTDTSSASEWVNIPSCDAVQYDLAQPYDLCPKHAAMFANWLQGQGELK